MHEKVGRGAPGLKSLKPMLHRHVKDPSPLSLHVASALQRKSSLLTTYWSEST